MAPNSNNALPCVFARVGASARAQNARSRPVRSPEGEVGRSGSRRVLPALLLHPMTHPWKTVSSAVLALLWARHSPRRHPPHHPPPSPPCRCCLSCNPRLVCRKCVEAGKIRAAVSRTSPMQTGRGVASFGGSAGASGVAHFMGQSGKRLPTRRVPRPPSPPHARRVPTRSRPIPRRTPVRLTQRSEFCGKVRDRRPGLAQGVFPQAGTRCAPLRTSGCVSAGNAPIQFQRSSPPVRPPAASTGRARHGGARPAGRRPAGRADVLVGQ